MVSTEAHIKVTLYRLRMLYMYITYIYIYQQLMKKEAKNLKIEQKVMCNILRGGKIFIINQNIKYNIKNNSHDIFMTNVVSCFILLLQMVRIVQLK